METANEIMKQVIPILMVPINDYLRYIISSMKYVRNMAIKMTELNAARVSVEEHMTRNTNSHLEVPTEVEGWLKDVEKIMEKAKTVPSDVGGCFNLKIKHRAGRSAFNVMEEIDSVMRRHSVITWTDHPIPLGKVLHSKKASTSKSSTEHNDFQSREATFTEALKALGPNHKAHMIALCGMGGVGKTTLMQKLKKVAKENRMFNYIIEAVIGEKTDPVAIQQAVADYLCIDLKESTKATRAERLREWFEDNSDGGKTKFLIVLDDVWQSVDLNDIGLSPLPNQGVDFKVLLTSRDTHVCTMMGVEADSIINVGLLTEVEAQSLFIQFVKPFDPELHEIGEEIVRLCHCLPIAIKTIACTLKNRRKDAWNDARSRLQHHDIGNVAAAVFRTSYENLPDKETKFVFLMCGFFPEDFDIPTEELVRYGWGLKLFDRVYTVREARNRLNTQIERLVQTNLLIESDHDGVHVKMHDLARAFVLGLFSEIEHAAIVNHGVNMPEWPENDMADSCKTISLTCESMSEFPRDLKFPSLRILKLMHGNKSLSFPQDFYEGMEKLRVISFDKMKYPMLPLSTLCSTNIRVLHLHKCSLRMFNFSCIGNLLNLEVLSFADSGIDWLPSTIGNLRKLRVLDLRGSDGLRIAQGVLENLVKLEELYMGFYNRFRYPRLAIIRMTDDNCNELAERSKGLSALEFEFYKNNAQPKNMSFEKLVRFKISVGRHYLFEDYFKRTYDVQNTMKLVTKKGELLESRLNELFVKTEVLCLSVDDMNDLGDVGVNSSSCSPQLASSFKILRVLVVSKCVELRYLFTIGVATDLSNLEHLEVNSCDNMEQLIYFTEENNTAENKGTIITFPKLKILSLNWLPKLLGFCNNNVNKIELLQLVELKLYGLEKITSIYPQNKPEASCLFEEDQVLIPKLEKLSIEEMKDLKEIWPHDYFRTSEEVINLREIYVRRCPNLVDLFPCNPMPLLRHLQELRVWECRSMEVLFNIDMDCVGETGEECINTGLRSIKVYRLWNLREVWRIKGAQNSSILIHGFQAVESIRIERCERFRNVLTPITTNFDLGALREISIQECGGKIGRFNESEGSSQDEKQEISISFLSCLIHSSHSLRKLKLMKCEGVDVVFAIESSRSRELVATHYNQQPLLPHLENLEISDMERVSHVWKCNWNKFLVLQNLQSESPFHNLTIIWLHHCKSIKYLFSPLMAKLLSNLKNVRIEMCYGIEEVVSNRDDEDEQKTASTHTDNMLFSRLDSLYLRYLTTLKHIGGGGGVKRRTNELSFDNIDFPNKVKLSDQAGGDSWTLCQYCREIEVWECRALSSVIPCYAAEHMQKLQVLKISYCNEMKEVFETQLGMNNSKNKSGCDEGNNGGIPRLNNVIMLPNLKILQISNCNRLEHILTFSALESLRQLEELKVTFCEALKVIVKKEEDVYGITKASIVVFPRLKSIELLYLPELEGFFLGMNIEFRFDSLDKVIIKNCPKMMVFAPGGSTAPKRKYIKTSFGLYSLEEECGLDFHVPITTAHHQCPATSEGTVWSFHNLIELDMESVDDVGKKIIPSGELLHLQKLEKIHVESCGKVEEVFEELEAGTNSSSGVDDSQTTVVKLPNLTQMDLQSLYSLRYICKSNQWTTFEFLNLKTLSIGYCGRIQHVFTRSMVSSLLQLHEIHIRNCDHIEEVIVKDTNVVVQSEESDSKTNEIVLPRLKSIVFEWLPRLKGLSLEKEDFSFPLFDTLRIEKCPAIMDFTKGNLATPKLREIETRYGSFYAGEDINSFIKSKQEKFR